MSWLTALLAGAAAGVLSGFGVGGGTLLLIYMTAFAGVDQHLAQGINLLYFLPTAATALPAHFKNGFVDKKSSGARHPGRTGGHRGGGLGRHRSGCGPAAPVFWGAFSSSSASGSSSEIA